ncbi:phenylacetic acid degradation protein PaaY [Insolitispirillum peregrinum]|uniref:Phenylacetic acid degradation protein n=1 Tax=Insolitispirillum peregrinum TaxID=80876 RepID=A0A1N7NG35_9PROT|nr:phenylacetic acid degradation protein PaaY [Insolitispirillum peregrinum]SIS97221.1 phenylacetic acid degradation protein [Insolitispirillum peregrinum]
MPCYSIDGVRPVVHPSAYVHPTAILIGDVLIGPEVYIGPAASLRGDFGRLRIESGANVQDNCSMHGFPGTETLIEEEGHIGHGAVLHGCIIRRGTLVGMNAVVMDGADIGAESLVAAMAFVKAGMIVPARSLVAGIPGKVIRAVTDDEYAWKKQGTADYQQLARRSLASMVECTPLSAMEADRPALPATASEPLYLKK